MRKPSPFLALGGLTLALGIAFGGGWALSQVNVTAGLGGLEAIVMAQGGPGGPSIFSTSGRLSSGPPYIYTASFPASFTVGGLMGTVNTAGMVTGGAFLINAANTAQTFTLPPTSQLIDGEVISFCNATNAAWATNAVTIAANTNQTILSTGGGTLTTLAAFSCAGFTWVSASAGWARGPT